MIQSLSVKRIAKLIWTDYSIILITILIFAIAGIFAPRFVSMPNLLLILRQSSIIGVLAMGMTFVIITGGIDLSSGHVVAVTCAVLIYLQGQPDMPLIVAILACLGVGAVIGLINGTIITTLRVPAFIITLAVGISARSAALYLVQGRALTGQRVPEFTSIYTGNTWIFPNPFLIWVAVAFIFGVILKYTKFGANLFAVGGNELAAKYTGISANKTKIVAYTIMGFCAGLAALLDFSRNAAISVPGAGLMYEFDAITAAVIGGAALSGGKGKMFTTFFGVIIISSVSNLMVMFGISPYLAGFVNGLIIMTAVLLQRREKVSL